MGENKKKKKKSLLWLQRVVQKADTSPPALKTTKRKVYISRSGCTLLPAINYELNNVQLNKAK